MFGFAPSVLSGQPRTETFYCILYTTKGKTDQGQNYLPLRLRASVFRIPILEE